MVTLFVGAFIATIGFFLASYRLMAVAIVFAVVGAAISLGALWRAIGGDPGIPARIRRRLRLNLLLAGPVVALQLLVYNYQPCSNLSGLGESTNARHT